MMSPLFQDNLPNVHSKKVKKQWNCFLEYQKLLQQHMKNNILSLGAEDWPVNVNNKG